MGGEKTAYHDRYIGGWNNHEPETVVAQFADGEVTFPDAFGQLSSMVVGAVRGVKR